MISQDKKISSLVAQQLPEHIRADYPAFVTFLQSYYQFLEQLQQPHNIIQNINEYHDIDTTTDLFVSYFKKEYAIDIPDSIVANKQLLYKHICDLHRLKGTEQGIKLLFRILFDDEISVTYPSEFLFKLSDGSWVVDTSITVVSTDTEPKFENTLLRGANSNASAIVERSTKHTINNITTYELYLNPNSISATKFISGEPITATIGSAAYTGTTTSSNIIHPGYYLNDKGQVSEKFKLHDGYYYQLYSYVVHSGQPLNTWNSVIKKIMHPAGMISFGEIAITTTANVKLKDAISPGLIFHYTMHGASRKVQTQSSNIFRQVNSYSQYGFGSTYSSIENYKFLYSPSAAGNKGYFGTTIATTTPSNTQIKDFAEFVIADFVNTPKKRQNRCIGAEIKIYKSSNLSTPLSTYYP